MKTTTSIVKIYNEDNNLTNPFNFYLPRCSSNEDCRATEMCGTMEYTWVGTTDEGVDRKIDAWEEYYKKINYD